MSARWRCWERRTAADRARSILSRVGRARPPSAAQSAADRALLVGLGGPSLCVRPRSRVPERAISLLAAIVSLFATSRAPLPSPSPSGAQVSSSATLCGRTFARADRSGRGGDAAVPAGRRRLRRLVRQRVFPARKERRAIENFRRDYLDSGRIEGLRFTFEFERAKLLAHEGDAAGAEDATGWALHTTEVYGDSEGRRVAALLEATRSSGAWPVAAHSPSSCAARHTTPGLAERPVPQPIRRPLTQHQPRCDDDPS